MRADRLFSIVLLLQRHGQMTARALAESLGVTERTIYRDIDALSLAGVPVYTRSGPDGGCFLDEGYRSNLGWFTGTELQALLYTGSASPLAELGMQQALDDAVLKLLARLPDRLQREATFMQQRLYLDPSGWYGTGADHTALPLLREAVWGDRWITATYQNWEGERQPRTLAPYSLVYKVGLWYLVGVNRERANVRTYRVSRLSDVTVLGDRFDRDPDFDIAAYWSEAAAQFFEQMKTYPVVVRVHPYMLPYFRTALPGRWEILEESVESLLMRVDYTGFEEARTSVLGMGTYARVVEPESLHTAVVAQAREIVAAFGDG